MTFLMPYRQYQSSWDDLGQRSIYIYDVKSCWKQQAEQQSSCIGVILHQKVRLLSCKTRQDNRKYGFPKRHTAIGSCWSPFGHAIFVRLRLSPTVSTLIPAVPVMAERRRDFALIQVDTDWTPTAADCWGHAKDTPADPAPGRTVSTHHHHHYRCFQACISRMQQRQSRCATPSVWD